MQIPYSSHLPPRALRKFEKRGALIKGTNMTLTENQEARKYRMYVSIISIKLAIFGLLSQ